MKDISVVIITKNESHNIYDCIRSAKPISNDIIVIDSKSTDDTCLIAEKSGARVIIVPWQGYGYARNKGAENATNDWILALDADERVTPELESAIRNMAEISSSVLVGFKRVNYFLGKKMLFGEWGKDKTYRLYNRTFHTWDLSPVHEILTGKGLTQKKIISGYVNHYPVITPLQNKEKTIRYAKLYAQKRFEDGKKASFIKRFLSPIFNFIKTYIFLLGFLDGRKGFIIALYTSRYVWLKYKFLEELNKGVKMDGV